MKSTLQKLSGKVFSAFNKSVLTNAKNDLGLTTTSFVRDGQRNFWVTLSSTPLYAIFGFIQKNDLSNYGILLSQRNRLKLNTISALTLLFFFGNNAMNAQTLLSNTTAVTQNFDSMAATTTLPTNWRMHASTSSPTWAGGSATVTQQASSGAPTTGGTYNFGSSASERSVGAMSSGSFASPSNLLGFYQNSNGSNLISLTVSYDAERYRINSAAASVQFYYSTNGTSWTAVTAGDIATSSFPTGSNTYNYPGTIVNKTGISITGLNIATNGAIYLRWNLNTTGTNSQGIAIDNISVVAGFDAATPTITGAATTSAFTTSYGSASAVQTFTVSGTLLTANLIATAPTGFEVSSDGLTYGTTATFTQSGGSASGSLRIRLAATAVVTGSYNSNTIVLSSTGATSKNITTPASGNTVSAKGLTITGMSGVNKIYNGLASASLTGTAAYSGLVNSQTFTVTGTPVANFANKNTGTAKPITVTGYTAPSTNYTVSQPTLSANITPKDLTVSNITASDKIYDGTVAAVLLATLSGVISPDAVTLTATGEFEANYQSIFFGTPFNIVNTSFTLNGNPTDLANYNLIQPSVSGLTADIYPKALTISNALASDKVFDGNTDAVVTGTLVGIVSGDSVTLISSGTFATAAIGTNIPVTPSWNIDGDTFNYTLTNPTVTLTANITSAGAPVITSATTASATYRDLTTSYFITSATTVDSYNATGLPPGLIVNTNTGAITGSPTAAGTFTVSLSATYNGETGFATLTYTINTIDLSIPDAVANDKPYDGNTNATISGTLTGAIPGDDVSFNGAGTFDSSAVATNVFVTPNITLTGSTASNYTITQPSGLSADITKKDVTIFGADVADKAYDGTTTATLSGTLSGVISPDAVTLNKIAAFADANVGNNKPVTSTSTITGTNSGNYNLVQPTGLTASITASLCTQGTATSGVVTWDFGTGAINASPSSNTTTGVTISAISTGNNLGTVAAPISTTSASTTYTGASGLFNIGAATRTGALVTGASGSAYIEFTLTPTAGNVTLTGISFGTRSTATAAQAYTLRSSADNYVADLATGTIANNSTWTLQTPTVSNVSATSLPVTYRLFGYNGTGSPGSGTINWRVDDLKLTIAGSSTQALSSPSTASVCSGSNFTYSPTTTFTGSTITWTRAAVVGISNATVTTPQSGNVNETLVNTTNAPVAVIYSFKVTGTTCYVTGDVTVTVNPLPIVTAANVSGCTGTAIVLSGAPAGGTFSVANPYTGTDTTYTHTYTNANGCTATSTSATITTNPIPATPIISAGGSTTFCSGGNVVLTSSAGTSYLWSNGATTQSITVTTGGNYTVKVGNASGCLSLASAVTTITVTSQLQWFLDADNDHYYSGVAVASCTTPGTGYTTIITGGGDCDDNNATINPGATEICYNNIDDNCTGILSEGCAAVPVNMTSSYNNTTLVSLGTAVPAVSYTYPGTSNLKFRFSITNTTTGQTSSDIIQTSRFVTIPGTMYSSPGVYTIKASAVINDEVVPYSGNTITVNAPNIPKITLAPGSCGATLAALTSTLTANAGQNATGYIFRIRLTSDNGPTPTYGTSSSSTRFVSANSFAGFPLAYGTSYSIAVQYTYNDPVSSASIVSDYGAECVIITPSIPTTSLASPTCGSQVSTINANISATSASYATAYQFRIHKTADVEGPYTEAAPNSSRFSSLTVFGTILSYNTQYSISVRYSILVNGSPVWSDYGSECVVKTPFFPTTSLVQSQCGQSTATSLTQQLNIIPYQGFPNYKVRLQEVIGEDLGTPQDIVIPYSYFRLNQFSSVQLDKSYNVSVAIQINGVFGDFSTECDIHTSSNSDGNNEGGSIVKTLMQFKATAYPNPFANNFMIDVKTASSSLVNLKVYDMIGRLIEQRNVSVYDMENTTIGQQYPVGVYNLVVSQENSVETIRMIKR